MNVITTLHPAISFAIVAIILVLSFIIVKMLHYNKSVTETLNNIEFLNSCKKTSDMIIKSIRQKNNNYTDNQIYVEGERILSKLYPWLLPELIDTLLYASLYDTNHLPE